MSHDTKELHQETQKGFTYIVTSAGGLSNQEVVIAASNAGALGVLDLEYAHTQEEAIEALGAVAAKTRGKIGIKLDGYGYAFWSGLIDKFPRQASCVVLTYSDQNSLKAQVEALRKQGMSVILEVTSLIQAEVGDKAGVDGLIVKGSEAGGRVGEETTFVLLQRIACRVALPVYAHGGIGMHTIAACYTAKAAGVVLDWQFALLRESSLPNEIKSWISHLDGTESLCVGQSLGQEYRMYAKGGLKLIPELREEEFRLASMKNNVERLRQWRESIVKKTEGALAKGIVMAGHDIVFASMFAKRFRTVAAALEGINASVSAHCEIAGSLNPLGEGSPLAQAHATRYPIVQGPMNRISDIPAFAAAVAQEGGLPFLALGMMRADEIEPLLKETKQLLGQKPWGVGFLGFIAEELLKSQVEMVNHYKPPFSLIAGGRPAQSHSLEAHGITTYLHIPSPRLLRLFMEDGVKHFIFEGRECGGHVGPLTSFVLWETCIATLLEMIPQAGKADGYSVLFAGGIDNALASAMVGTLAALLAQRGVRVGVQVGTSYLFTREALETGAICGHFQDALVHGEETVVLDSGGGHAIRCLPSHYVTTFENEKRRLYREGNSTEKIRVALEHLSVGRLRIAAKGIAFNPESLRQPHLSDTFSVSEEIQRKEGLYMIGQTVALRQKLFTIKELHYEISQHGYEALRAVVIPETIAAQFKKPYSGEIAIIGMSCILPKAKDLKTYWENILNKVNAVTEIPKERWDLRHYYDSDPKKKDKIYSKWGGFIDPVAFEPTQYGIPPNSMKSIDPAQILALEVTRLAMKDAGYMEREFDREYTSVIFGASGGLGDQGSLYSLRSLMPLFVDNIPEEISKQLPEWTEDSFSGLLLNVVSGRIANNFNLGGINCTVDAACASSLAALYQGVRELTVGTSNMVIVGGVDTVQSPFGYFCFGKTHALSPSGQGRTFDASADGIVISEGVAAVVLKRVEDAERDGDRIYAVIEAVSGSSDGKGKSLSAPLPEGQVRTLQRAYKAAGVSIAAVELFEAHGTGTVAGDRSEATSLDMALRSANARPKSCAVGSVKSMIGHTKAAAGIVGLIKVVLSLYYKVFPPSLGVKTPNPQTVFNSNGPLYVNTYARPWINSRGPRRAGVSAFGFGGTNFHALLKEYNNDAVPPASSVIETLPSELFFWRGASAEELGKSLEPLESVLARGTRLHLRDLAYTVCLNALEHKQDSVRLAIVAQSLNDLKDTLSRVRQRLQQNPESIRDIHGVYYSSNPLAKNGKIAFLFPGQGSQYPDMFRDLAIISPEMRECFVKADQALHERLSKRLSEYIFPYPSFSDEEHKARAAELTRTDVAQPALAAVEMGLLRVLESFGVRSDMVAGHSCGEYVALSASGAFSEETLYELLHYRGTAILEMESKELGTMLAAMAGPEQIKAALGDVTGVYLANFNSPTQTVLSGHKAALEEAKSLLKAGGIKSQFIPVNCAFHSPYMEPARSLLAKKIAAITFTHPRIGVYSNSLARGYPKAKEEIISCLSDHLTGPVLFTQEIEAMFNDGARIFVEVGPRSVLTNLIKQILGSRNYAAIACNSSSAEHDSTQLHYLLARLAVEGIDIEYKRLFRGREAARIDFSKPDAYSSNLTKGPATWMVTGDCAWPAQEARPQRKRIELSKPLQTAGGERLDTPEQGGYAVDLPAKGLMAKPPADSSKAEVMIKHQKLMAIFLEQQKDIMLTYLHGSGKAQKSIPFVPHLASGQMQKVKSIAVPAQLPAVEKKESDTTAVTKEEIEKILIRVASERTGYPPEMLGIDLNIEADLGIDSIKRVEIIATFRKSLPHAPADLTEHLNTVKSLRNIIDQAWGLYQKAQPLAEKTSAQLPAGVSLAQPLPADKKESDTTAVTKEEIEKILIRVASERTGYPLEMLGIDLNIEADLGIDSIKRVEIIATFRKSLPHAPADLAERLNAAKSLRAIIDQAWELCQKAQPSAEIILTPTPAVKAVEAEVSMASEATAPRCMFSLIEQQCTLTNFRVKISEGVIVITDSDTPYAMALQAKIQELGGVAVIARLGRIFEQLNDKVFTVNLTDPSEVESFLKQLRATYKSIGGLVHLLPLREAPLAELSDILSWQRYANEEVKSLFYLLRAGAEDLKKGHGKWVIACTRLGGSKRADTEYLVPERPWQGGIIGILKTIAQEWPDAFCKSIDIDEATTEQAMVSQFLCETNMKNGEVEVYYRNSRRWISKAYEAPFHSHNGPRIKISKDDVILVTGGARGITAHIAKELARLYKPTILLVGRSAWPNEESAVTAGVSSPDDLKKTLIAQMSAAGTKATPKEVNTACEKILAQRQMRDTKRVLNEYGAKAFYYQVDVRDNAAFIALINTLYKTHGRLDGVIHGAGVIEDKLLEDKADESFDRVFDTKVHPALVLSAHLKKESLKFLVFFSSIAGSFGNRGQSDYAAANEVLNRLAMHLDYRRDCRVVAINWGPWKNVGMANFDLQRQFIERGIIPIDPIVGSNALIEELSYGEPGEPLVVVGKGPWAGKP